MSAPTQPSSSNVAAITDLLRAATVGRERDTLMKKLYLRYHPDQRRPTASTSAFQDLQEAISLVQGPGAPTGPTLLIEGPPPTPDPTRDRDLAPKDPRLAQLTAVPGVTLATAGRILEALPRLEGATLSFVRALLARKIDPLAIISFCTLHPAFPARGEALETTLALLAPPRFTLVQLAALLEHLPRLAVPHVPMVRVLVGKGQTPADIGKFCVSHVAFATGDEGPYMAAELLQGAFGLPELTGMLTTCPTLGRRLLPMARVLLGKNVDAADVGTFCTTYGDFAESIVGPQVADDLLGPTFVLGDLVSLVTAFPRITMQMMPMVRVLLGRKVDAGQAGAFCATHAAFAGSAEGPQIAGDLLGGAFDIAGLGGLVTAFPAVSGPMVPMVKVLLKKGQSPTDIAGLCTAQAAFARSADGPILARELLAGTFGLAELGELVAAYPAITSAVLASVRALLSRKVGPGDAGRFCATHQAFAAGADGAPTLKGLPKAMELQDVEALVSAFPAITPAALPLVARLQTSVPDFRAVGAFCATHPTFALSADGVRVAGPLLAISDFTVTELGLLVGRFPAVAAAHVPIIKVLLQKNALVDRIAAFCQAHSAFAATTEGKTVAQDLVDLPNFKVLDLQSLVTAFPAIAPGHVPLIKCLRAKGSGVNEVGAFCAANGPFVATPGAALVADQLLGDAFTLTDLGALLGVFPGLTLSVVPVVTSLKAKGGTDTDAVDLCSNHATFAASAEGHQVMDALVAPPAFTVANLETVLTGFPTLAAAHVESVKALKARGAPFDRIGSFCRAHTAFAASADGPDVICELVDTLSITVTRLDTLLTGYPGLRLAEVKTVRKFLTKNALPADIGAFCTHHAAVAAHADGPEVVEYLLERGGTAPRIDALVTLLAGLDAAQLKTAFSVYLMGAPIATLETRIPALLVGSNPAAVLSSLSVPKSGTTQALGQKLETLTPEVAKYVRAAMNIKGWNPTDVLEFLKVNAVRTRLGVTPMKKNPAYWIWMFALHHQGAPAAAGPGIVDTVNVPGRGNVQITEWILAHVVWRHTFHGFNFWDADTMARATSSMLDHGFDVTAKARQLILSGEVAAGPWDGSKIQVGTWEVRIARVPGPGPVLYRPTAMFPETLAEMPIPKAVMEAIHTHLIP